MCICEVGHVLEQGQTGQVQVQVLECKACHVTGSKTALVRCSDPLIHSPHLRNYCCCSGGGYNLCRDDGTFGRCYFN